jgi:hypothetical protein
MLETVPGGLLQTWRAPEWPITGTVRLTPLAPHRREYLTYEGPVAGNRGGDVTRVAEGTFERSVDEYVLSPANGRPLHLRLRGDVAEASVH